MQPLTHQAEVKVAERACTLQVTPLSCPHPFQHINVGSLRHKHEQDLYERSGSQCLIFLNLTPFHLNVCGCGRCRTLTHPSAPGHGPPRLAQPPDPPGARARKQMPHAGVRRWRQAIPAPTGQCFWCNFARQLCFSGLLLMRHSTCLCKQW